MSLIEKEPILRILEAAIEKENNTAHEYALKGADYAEYHAKYTHGAFCYIQARKAIEAADTVQLDMFRAALDADVVEVVRCKNCTNAIQQKNGYYCSVDGCIAHNETDYCSCGERRAK